MVAIIKKQHGIKESLSRILQVLSVNVFSKETLHQLLAASTIRDEPITIRNQLIFNDF